MTDIAEYCKTLFSPNVKTLKINPIDKSLTLAFVAYFKKSEQKRQYWFLK